MDATTAMPTDHGSKSGKSPEALCTISELAEELPLPPHVLRFWETQFSRIKPMKHAGNRRLYRPNHVALMRDVARREDFYALVRFGRTVTGARWDEGTYRCRVETAEYERHVCRVLVSGMGPLHAPRLPDVPGLDRFRGPAFHSARWDDDAELAGMVWQVGGCRSWQQDARGRTRGSGPAGWPSSAAVPAEPA